MHNATRPSARAVPWHRSAWFETLQFLALTGLLAAFVGRMVNDYQAARIRALVNPGAASTDDLYQAENAMRAIGTGGLWGKGWLQGPLTNGRDIPVMWADFPFAAVGEQFGRHAQAKSLSGQHGSRCCVDCLAKREIGRGLHGHKPVHILELVLAPAGLHDTLSGVRQIDLVHAETLPCPCPVRSLA